MKKLQWGMIGGGEGSQIGPAHRLGSGLDSLFEFSAGALDHRPEEGIDYGKRLGLGDRAYGSWQEMLADPSIAGPIAPSAARPCRLRSMCKADQVSTVASVIKATKTINPHKITGFNG